MKDVVDRWLLPVLLLVSGVVLILAGERDIGLLILGGSGFIALPGRVSAYQRRGDK